MSWLAEVETTMGRRGAVAAAAAVVAGAAAFVAGLAGGDAPRAFGALIASWLFVFGAAMGAVTFRAFFRIVAAGWARPLSRLAGGLAGAGAPALALLLVIVAGAGLAPWIPRPVGWLSPPALAVREVALGALLFGLAWRWFRGAAPEASVRRAVAWCVTYALVGSVWGYDLVLGPDPVAVSTLVGPYVFMAGFIAGTSLLVLLALLRRELGERERRDAASFVLALAVFWAYLLGAQYLTSWYGQRPEETAYLGRRAVDGWPWVTGLVIALVFAVPFLGLLHPAGRRSARALEAILAAQLAGLWLHCHLLVAPSTAAPGTAPVDLRDLLVLTGVLGAFALAVAPGWRRATATPLAADRPDVAGPRVSTG